MSVHVTTCPHCDAEKIALKTVHLHTLTDYSGYALALCPNCRLPTTLLVAGTGRQRVSFSHLLHSGESFELQSFVVTKMWPENSSYQPPEFVPQSVRRALEQGETNFRLPNHEEASGVMYRKALELGLKQIDPSLTGTLARRIETLGKEGKLTSSLVEWAQEIKNLGNDGAHEDEPISKKELEALRGLTEMVLKYLFTLPGMIAARRESIAQENLA